MDLILILCSTVSLMLSVSTSNVSITRTQDRTRRYSPGELIFRDEFDKFSLDVWTHEISLGGANWEFNMNVNSRENSFVRDGKLFIKPTLSADVYGDDFIFQGQLSLESGENEGCTTSVNYGCFRSGSYPNIINPVASAKIYTLNSFYFKYGRVEVRAKLPAGDWMWPAIWMMPRFNAYGGWPRSGEIDIMESRGNRKYFDWQGVNIGTEAFTSALHFGPRWDINGYEATLHKKNSEENNGFDRDFHVYGLEWTDDHISFMLDGVVTRTVRPPDEGFWKLGGFGNSLFNPWKGAENERMAPFDQKFYLILNVAVGGTNNYFPDGYNVNGPRPWPNAGGAPLKFYDALDDWYWTWSGDDGAMQVDYIRVYAI